MHHIHESKLSWQGQIMAYHAYAHLWLVDSVVPWTMHPFRKKGHAIIIGRLKGQCIKCIMNCEGSKLCTHHHWFGLPSKECL